MRDKYSYESKKKIAKVTRASGRWQEDKEGEVKVVTLPPFYD
jgi:hypothetical protein